MTAQRDLVRANKRLVRNLFFAAVAMFGFGYAMVPLYDVFCEITGLNGKTGRAEAAQAAKVANNRWVTIEFTGNTMRGLPWEFRPMQKKMRVRVWELTPTRYYARNAASEVIAGQAVPSVTPSRAASYFKKTECFCFSRQELKAHEVKEMPVWFIVDPALPQDVHTITLSYAFFNADKGSSERYAGKEGTRHASRIARPALAGS